MTQSREVRLKQRPVGLPKADDFEIATVSLPDPSEGEMLIRNLYMSVDPYMRGRMIDRKSYIPPFAIGEPLQGGCVGEVIASNGGRFNVGDHVLSMDGWREYTLSDGTYLNQIDPTLAPVQSFLGAMGMPGQTAYFGLLEIGNPQPDETVFVSAAAGAVGSIVCQIAKLKGCKVIGSAGSDTKVAWLVDELGIDAAISQYNDTTATPGPSNMAMIIGKRLKLQGFIVSDFSKQIPEFYKEMGQWAAQGKIKWNETILDGIDNAPNAFIGLFNGENLGKMLVKLA